MTSDGEHESEQAGSQPELPVAGSRREPDPAAPGSPEPEAVDHPSVDQPAARSSPWPARLTAIASPSYEWVMRPRVRLSLTGGLLLLIGVLLMSNSVWTLPLVVVGALMIVIAWIGHRLEGRFTIEWGQGGTELAFRATIKPAQPAHEGLTTLAGAASAPHEPVSAPEPVREQIIDGEAHTVEIDVGELKTLIAAVESAQADGRPAGPLATDIRIRRVAGGGRPSESVL